MTLRVVVDNLPSSPTKILSRSAAGANSAQETWLGSYFMHPHRQTYDPPPPSSLLPLYGLLGSRPTWESHSPTCRCWVHQPSRESETNVAHCDPHRQHQLDPNQAWLTPVQSPAPFFAPAPASPQPVNLANDSYQSMSYHHSSANGGIHGVVSVEQAVPHAASIPDILLRKRQRLLAHHSQSQPQSQITSPQTRYVHPAALSVMHLDQSAGPMSSHPLSSSARSIPLTRHYNIPNTDPYPQLSSMVNVAPSSATVASAADTVASQWGASSGSGKLFMFPTTQAKTTFVPQNTGDMICYLWFSTNLGRPQEQRDRPGNAAASKSRIGQTSSSSRRGDAPTSTSAISRSSLRSSISPITPTSDAHRLQLQFSPSPAFIAFLDTLLRATQLSQGVIILSLHYIYRLKLRNPHICGLEGSEFRLAVIALMLANKFLDDNTYTNKTWSEISGISLPEINLMEREFLQGLDHALHIDFGTYQRWGKLLGGLLLAKEKEKGTWTSKYASFAGIEPFGGAVEPNLSREFIHRIPSNASERPYVRARSSSPTHQSSLRPGAVFIPPPPPPPLPNAQLLQQYQNQLAPHSKRTNDQYSFTFTPPVNAPRTPVRGSEADHPMQYEHSSAPLSASDRGAGIAGVKRAATESSPEVDTSVNSISPRGTAAIGANKVAKLKQTSIGGLRHQSSFRDVQLRLAQLSLQSGHPAISPLTSPTSMWTNGDEESRFITQGPNTQLTNGSRFVSPPKPTLQQTLQASYAHDTQRAVPQFLAFNALASSPTGSSQAQPSPSQLSRHAPTATLTYDHPLSTQNESMRGTVFAQSSDNVSLGARKTSLRYEESLHLPKPHINDHDPQLVAWGNDQRRLSAPLGFGEHDLFRGWRNHENREGFVSAHTNLQPFNQSGQHQWQESNLLAVPSEAQRASFANAGPAGVDHWTTWVMPVGHAPGNSNVGHLDPQRTLYFPSTSRHPGIHVTAPLSPALTGHGSNLITMINWQY